MNYTPTLAGFLAWVRSAMGVPTSALADDSVYLGYAFDVALALVNLQIQTSDDTGGLIYMLAVYNLGGDNLVNWAQDVPPSTYWADLRDKMDILDFFPGVVSATGDQGTSTSIQVIENLKNLVLGDLQNLKTPWGRQYLNFAMQLGTGWGIS